MMKKWHVVAMLFCLVVLDVSTMYQLKKLIKEDYTNFVERSTTVCHMGDGSPCPVGPLGGGGGNGF